VSRGPGDATLVFDSRILFFVSFGRDTPKRRDFSKLEVNTTCDKSESCSRAAGEREGAVLKKKKEKINCYLPGYKHPGVTRYQSRQEMVCCSSEQMHHRMKTRALTPKLIKLPAASPDVR